jgi:hypothetical protein
MDAIRLVIDQWSASLFIHLQSSVPDMNDRPYAAEVQSSTQYMDSPPDQFEEVCSCYLACCYLHSHLCPISVRMESTQTNKKDTRRHACKARWCNLDTLIHKHAKPGCVVVC